jgi:hypothetical protein
MYLAYVHNNGAPSFVEFLDLALRSSGTNTPKIRKKRTMLLCLEGICDESKTTFGVG